MLNRISVVLAMLLVAASPLTRSEAVSRAAGNRMAIAQRVGLSLFTQEWPAQVLKVRADGTSGSVVLGLLLSGAKFHHPLSQAAFDIEVENLIARTFAADKRIDEVDAWAIIPVPVAPGSVVSGSLAIPTSRTVFTVSTLRSESRASLAQRLTSGRDIFWDEDWRRSALKSHP